MKYYNSEGEDATGLEEWFDEAATERFGSTLAMLQEIEKEKAGKAPKTPTAEGEEDAELDEEAAEEEAPEVVAPEGAGWVVELSGYHFHNSPQWLQMQGSEYVKRTLVKDLMEGSVSLPGPDGQPMSFTNKEMGISHVLIAHDGGISKNREFENPDWQPPNPFEEYEDPDTTGLIQEEKKEDVPRMIKPRIHEFKVHFLWKPKRLSDRIAARNAPTEGTDDQLAEGDN